jgi:hypothetical protein
MKAASRKAKGFFHRNKAESLRHLAVHRLGELVLSGITTPADRLTCWAHRAIDAQLLRDATNPNSTWLADEPRHSFRRLRQLLSVSPHYEEYIEQLDIAEAERAGSSGN